MTWEDRSVVQFPRELEDKEYYKEDGEVNLDFTLWWLRFIEVSEKVREYEMVPASESKEKKKEREEMLEFYEGEIVKIMKALGRLDLTVHGSGKDNSGRTEDL